MSVIRVLEARSRRFLGTPPDGLEIAVQGTSQERLGLRAYRPGTRKTSLPARGSGTLSQLRNSERALLW
jgi:hypothetical protein